MDNLVIVQMIVLSLIYTPNFEVRFCKKEPSTIKLV